MLRPGRAIPGAQPVTALITLGDHGTILSQTVGVAP